MTLTPETRVLLTDALRPPAGFAVDVAVGTTYSLNLTALLLAPLSFALFDQSDSDDLGAVDPIRLLEAVRRHIDHTFVFCQAGGIHVPSHYRSILTFVEDSVLEVMPPAHAGLFHPKIWALRFVERAGGRRHRLVVLSRNMTLDRSWDTALVLDEDPVGVIDAAPAAEFVRGLPGLTVRPLERGRRTQIADLADSLRSVRLAAPAPFDEGRLLPIGLDSAPVWPFPERARRLLAISPFLTRNAVRALSGIARERTLVSRPESLELIGSKVLNGWQVKVLQRVAEVDPADDAATAPRAVTEYQGTDEGLHAKTFILDLPGSRSTVITGSANLTGSPWGASVEFDVALTGPTWGCGVKATLDGAAEVPGLTRILENYTVTNQDGVADPTIETSFAIERFHQLLATGLPDVHVIEVDDNRVEFRLAMTIPSDPPGITTVWPASLPADSQRQPLQNPLVWTIAPTNVTPFIAVETTAGEGEARVTSRCVLKATLGGAVDGRRRNAVISILTSKQDVLRYLVFLLGDPSYDALFAQLAGVGAERIAGNRPAGWSTADIALFEPLVRAAGRDADALARVASVVEDLRSAPEGTDLVPDGFDRLWDIVWQAHLESSRG